MGIFNLFSRRPDITEPQIPEVTRSLGGALEGQRDLFYAGMIYVLKSEGIDASHLPKAVEDGTDVDSVLRALQLVSVVGFSYRYMNVQLFGAFEAALVACMDNGHEKQIEGFRESYLDCEGDWSCLTERVAKDLHRLFGAPEPRAQAKNGIAAGVGALIAMSQACVAACAGDTKTEQNLKKSVGAR